MVPRACVRVYAPVLVPSNLYIPTYIPILSPKATAWLRRGVCCSRTAAGASVGSVEANGGCDGRVWRFDRGAGRGGLIYSLVIHSIYSSRAAVQTVGSVEVSSYS